jgi:hypothetical protein
MMNKAKGYKLTTKCRLFSHLVGDEYDDHDYQSDQEECPPHTCFKNSFYGAATAEYKHCEK